MVHLLEASVRMLSLSFYPDLYELAFDPASYMYHCLISLRVFNPVCMLLLMFYSPVFQVFRQECGIYRYYMSVNLQFTILEYTYIWNVTVVP